MRCTRRAALRGASGGVVRGLLRTGARIGAGLGVALWGAAPALAIDLWGTGPLAGATVQVQSDFELRYHHVPEKLEFFEDNNYLDYFEQVERINLQLTKDSLTVGAQIDEVAFFANNYVLDGVEVQERPLYTEDIISPWKAALVRLEKVTLNKRWAHLELEVGDTYASFGRGIVLNVVKNTNIDIDTSLRGANVAVSSGDLEFAVVSGLTNTQDISQDNPNATLVVDEDAVNMITGARLEHYAVGPFHAGVHGVVYRFGRAENVDQPAGLRYTEPLDALASGAFLEASLGGIDWYVEGDVFGYQSIEMTGTEEETSTGYATYMSASAYPGPVALTLEAKATTDTERINAFTTAENWEVAQVPSLEYENVITEDASAAVNSNDLLGARVRADFAVKPGEFVPYVSVAAFRDEDLEGLHFNTVPETIAHPVAGVDLQKGGYVVQANGGYRVDVRDGGDGDSDRMAHADATVQVPVAGGNSFEIAVNTRRFWWGANGLDQHDFLEMNNALAWHQGDKLAFIVYQDFTNNPLVQSIGNFAVLDGNDEGNDEDLYGAVEVIWHPKPSSTVRAFYGAYKAGIRCAGGQCRSLPGFEGGRVSWQATF
jgi:hypothetical protein